MYVNICIGCSRFIDANKMFKKYQISFKYIYDVYKLKYFV